MKDTSGLSQRATWIFCAGRKCATLFRSRYVEEGIDFIRSVSCSPHFAEDDWLAYLADELNVLCGAGTDNHLVICAEPGLRERLMTSLDPLALESVTGTVDVDLSGVERGELLMPYVREFLPSEPKLGRKAPGEAA